MWKKKEKFKQIGMGDENNESEVEYAEAPDPLEQATGKVKVKEEPKERIVVVKELPVQQIRTTKGEDGIKRTFITIEEALTEIINSE